MGDHNRNLRGKKVRSEIGFLLVFQSPPSIIDSSRQKYFNVNHEMNGLNRKRISTITIHWSFAQNVFFCFICFVSVSIERNLKVIFQFVLLGVKQY